MPDQPQSDEVIAAYAALASAGGDPLRLNEPMRTLVLADTALGLIGNGGVEYFFESDFPGNPDYSVFVLAFKNLGLDYLASGLQDLVNLFPSGAPHLDQDKRVSFLAAPSQQFQRLASQLNERVWQDSTIDGRLQSYGSAA